MDRFQYKAGQNIDSSVRAKIVRLDMSLDSLGRPRVSRWLDWCYILDLQSSAAKGGADACVAIMGEEQRLFSLSPPRELSD